MKSGALRHRLDIQVQQDQRDSFGSVVGEWQTQFRPYGEITQLSGREYFAAQQFNPEITHKIRLRYVPGLTPKMRIRLATRIFEINHLLNVDERNKEIELYATERL